MDMRHQIDTYALNIDDWDEHKYVNFFNILRSRQIDRHFADDIKFIFLNENF